ncbi:MAG: hypothetical protein HYR60_08455 [Acidobacteria bacterium]|nr:hypothetical protein [Acidobacteriota bacterium]
MRSFRWFKVWVLLALPAAAQDAFEIQVYEYETVPKKLWNLETHLNYIGKGTKSFDGTVAPTHNQIHMTYELTRGITDHFELAGYLVLARRPGVTSVMEYAGWRIRPRVRLPESWKLPVKVSISGEVGFPRKTYEENAAAMEIRPILERQFGRLQLDFNPTFVRALRGPGTKEGWEFEPAFRAGWEVNKRWDASAEYYGSTGPVTGFFPVREQAHIFYPGFDFKASERVAWNLGIGVAATPAGNRLTFKTRLGVLFGRAK